MKEIVKTSRLAGQLEKLFRMLNEDFFDGQLETAIITVQSTPRAYGHYSVSPIWSVRGKEDKHEINIAAGTLDRPIENTVATLLHEMCHMYCGTVLHVQDCSRGGTYHNKHFKAAAEAHGLICTRSEKYGWSDTSSVISDTILEWILENNISEIKLTRNEPGGIRITGGNTAASGGAAPTVRPKSNSRRWVCPSCGAIVRSTRTVNIICGDCMQTMTETITGGKCA